MALCTNETPWYTDFVNFLTSGVFPTDLSFHGKKKLLADAKFYQWEDPILYKHCEDQVVRRCVQEEEMKSILDHCHTREVGGNFGAPKTAAKVL